MGQEFLGKTIIVTGASEGIGRAFCQLVSEQRPNLVLAARNNQRLQELAEECGALGAKTLVVPTDVSDAEACRALVALAVERFGGIDLLLNNAGITMWAYFKDTTKPELIDHVLRINFLSSAYCTHYALPYLLASRGRIAMVSSVAGLLGVPGHAIYGASKHAMSGFCHSLRNELKATGVSVTLICPDFVHTEIHDRGLKADGSQMRKRLPANRAISAEKCAEMMLAAVSTRRRLMITSLRGRLGYKLRDLLPSLVDFFVRSSAQGHAHLTQ